MYAKHLKKAAIYTLPILAILLVFTYRYSCISFFNENFVSQRFNLPKRGEDFIITPDHEGLPTVIINIIKLSFPEYNIVTSKTKKPHLIIQSVHSKRRPILEELKNKSPYIVYSGESKPRIPKKYRANGHPVAQFIPFYKPNQKNHLFLPFIVWGKPNLFNSNRRTPPNKEGLINKKNIVYAHTRCVPTRDIFFRMLKISIPSVEARGKCSNDGLPRFSGTYIDLKHHYSNYKFTLSMEHAKYPGYITEKIANSFEAGNIPIYWGGTNVMNRFINPKSYIDIDSYMTFEAAIQDIKNLSNDPKRMQRILSEPILTKEGVALMGINDTNLSDESVTLLKDTAETFRKLYITKSNKTTIQEEIKNYLQSLF